MNLILPDTGHTPIDELVVLEAMIILIHPDINHHLTDEQKVLEKIDILYPLPAGRHIVLTVMTITPHDVLVEKNPKRQEENLFQIKGGTLNDQ